MIFDQNFLRVDISVLKLILMDLSDVPQASAITAELSHI